MTQPLRCPICKTKKSNHSKSKFNHQCHKCKTLFPVTKQETPKSSLKHRLGLAAVWALCGAALAAASTPQIEGQQFTQILMMSTIPATILLTWIKQHNPNFPLRTSFASGYLSLVGVRVLLCLQYGMEKFEDLYVFSAFSVVASCLYNGGNSAWKGSRSSSFGSNCSSSSCSSSSCSSSSCSSSSCSSGSSCGGGCGGCGD